MKRTKRFLSALSVPVAVLWLAAPETLASGSLQPLAFGGGVKLKPIATRACKSSANKPKQLTYIECFDTGEYHMLRMQFGASYRWRWTLRGTAPDVGEIGAFAINLGNGVLSLTMEGTARRIGSATAASGAAKTTGTWKYTSGTGAYKNRSGRGRYSFEVRRSATKYLVLGLALQGTIR